MKACEAASKMNVDIINVHALGGKEMMSAAKRCYFKSTNKIDWGNATNKP